jgi:hypothetical protein
MRLRLLIAACATALVLALPAQALADQGSADPTGRTSPNGARGCH